MKREPRQSESARLKLAADLMFLVGRYHDEDGTDRWYAKAAAALREADVEIVRLREALIAMDEAVCHGSPETAKRIAREAYNQATERVET